MLLTKQRVYSLIIEKQIEKKNEDFHIVMFELKKSR